MDIATRLVNFVAEVKVTQTYKNVEENPIETEYMFPIEEGAAVTNFKVDLEGRSIISKVRRIKLNCRYHFINSVHLLQSRVQKKYLRFSSLFCNN